MSPTKAAVGCLLKDWNTIAGRENSEPGSIDNKSETVNELDFSEEIKQTDSSSTCTREIKKTCDEASKVQLTNVAISFQDNTTILQRIENCRSPDLFDSDDDCNNSKSTPFTQEFDNDSSLVYDTELTGKPLHLSKLNCENSKKSLKEVSSPDTIRSHTSELVDALKFGDIRENSIEHFEGFPEEADVFAKNVENKLYVDLAQSSNEDSESDNNDDQTSIKNNVEVNRTNIIGEDKKVQCTSRQSSNRVSNISFEYNSTKSLNVTDYVIDILNSQEINAVDHEINQQKTRILAGNYLINSQQNMEVNNSQPQQTYRTNSKNTDFCGDDILNPKISSQRASTCSQKHSITLNDEERIGGISQKYSENIEIEQVKVDNLDYTVHYTFHENDYIFNPEISSQTQSTCSQQSMVILSDEELNYSSKFSAKYEKGFYDLTDSDDCVNEDIQKEELEAVHTSNCSNINICDRPEDFSIHHTHFKMLQIPRYGLRKLLVGQLKNKYSQEKVTEDKVESQVATTIDQLPSNVLISEQNEAINENVSCSSPNACITNLKNKPSKAKVSENKIDRTNVESSSAATVDGHSNVLTPGKNQVVNKNPSSSTTPNCNVMIKTDNVTPMADYDAMNTPTLQVELDKFGIKPLKRQRGVQLLKYIYESTHPLVSTEDLANEHEQKEEERRLKRRKLSKSFETIGMENIKIVGTALIENEMEENLLFERKFSKKKLSCRIPLQIVWYNFLCCNPSLVENIILYEPIQLEVIHSMLKEQSSCNFHIQDLITFLDEKCVTFRTCQSQGNRKKLKEIS